VGGGPRQPGGRHAQADLRRLAGGDGPAGGRRLGCGCGACRPTSCGAESGCATPGSDTGPPWSRAKPRRVGRWG
jgi:hypothetical protein